MTRGPNASVVIAAHNESSVIERCLTPLAPAAADGELSIVVVCNGCTDDTARRARSFSGVTVAELSEPSKIKALRLGDVLASGFPRLYVDADVEVPLETVRVVAGQLRGIRWLAGRPPLRYDAADSSWVVRRFYAARTRLPGVMSALWGAGFYAMSDVGRDRFGEFPDVVADDLFVHGQFSVDEIAIPECAPVVVRTPRTSRDLLTMLSRHFARDRLADPGHQDRGTTRQTMQELARSVTGSRELVDAAVYAAFVAAARIAARRSTRSSAAAGRPWERDESSRGRPAGVPPA